MKVVLKMTPILSRLTAPVVRALGGVSRMKALRNQIEQLEDRLDEEVKLRQEAIETMRWERARQARAEAEDLAAAAGVPHTGLNTTSRSKMLKMYRMGQPVEQIAETMKVPRGEVDLLVRVHEIAMRAFREVEAEPAALRKNDKPLPIRRDKGSMGEAKEIVV